MTDQHSSSESGPTTPRPTTPEPSQPDSATPGGLPQPVPEKKGTLSGMAGGPPPHTLEIQIPGRDPVAYPVLVGIGTWTQLESLLPRDRHGIAVVTDQRVWKLWGRALMKRLTPLQDRVEIYQFPSGDHHKTRETKAEIEDQLLGDRHGRDVVILALGGGVVTDLGGYLAATYLRGVRYLSLPTTLLCMVDAAIGGKTGVNTPMGKNLVGTFYQPLAVVSDVQTIQTLPDAEYENGLAETVKHAVMADATLFSHLLDHAKAVRVKRLDAVIELVIRSAQVKAAVVARDELDRGYRQILNFGHTIGHALEAATGFSLSHGHAVSIGMCVEADAAVHASMLPGRVRDELAGALDALHLPTRLPPGVDAEHVVASLAVDKKNRQGQVMFALPDSIGSAAPFDGRFVTPLPRDAVVAALVGRQ